MDVDNRIRGGRAHVGGLGSLQGKARVMDWTLAPAIITAARLWLSGAYWRVRTAWRRWRGRRCRERA